jgi:glycosyltransferase involved in cell wall biosynthesis
MRVVIATESYWPNIDGGALAQRRLARELSSRGHEVSVIAPGRSFRNYVEKDDGTAIYRMRAVTFPLYKDYKVSTFPFNQVRKRLAALRPDVVHVHNPYAIGRAALSVARKARIPVVGSNHIMPENLFQAVSSARFAYDFLRDAGWKFITDFYNQCDVTISPTETARRLLVDNGLAGESAVVSNGVDLSTFRPGLDSVSLRQRHGIPGVPTVLYTGRLSGEKQLEVLLDAVPSVIDSVDAHFVVCGSGRERARLEEYAAEKGLARDVTFTGFIPDADFPKTYSMASVFAMPSEAELQSVSTLEACASGLPVVAADCGALPELVKNGRNGFLFPRHDSDALAERLVSVLKSNARQRRMGRESLRVARPHEMARVVKKFERVYEKAS